MYEMYQASPKRHQKCARFPGPWSPHAADGEGVPASSHGGQLRGDGGGAGTGGGAL